MHAFKAVNRVVELQLVWGNLTVRRMSTEGATTAHSGNVKTKVRIGRRGRSSRQQGGEEEGGSVFCVVVPSDFSALFVLAPLPHSHRVVPNGDHSAPEWQKGGMGLSSLSQLVLGRPLNKAMQASGHPSHAALNFPAGATWRPW